MTQTPATKTPAIGDILSSGWGYEQTRYDFYQVVKVTAKSVQVRQIAKTYVEHGPVQGYAKVMPVKDQFTGEAMTKRFKSYDSKSYSIGISSYSSASLWDGNPEQESGDY